MDVEDYRAARRTRLVELAVGLGVPADDAGPVVDRVIEAQRRRIARADDPDEVVVPALREEVLGRPRSRVVPAVILGLVAVVVAAFAVALVPRADDEPDGRPGVPPAQGATVPSLLGLTADEATAALTREHIALEVRPVPQCNPAGQVLGSLPPAGAPVGGDDVVTVIATSAPGWTCPDDEDARDTAWAFLRYLVTGSARPDFADEVGVYVDGRPVAVVSGTEPATSPVWLSAVHDPVVHYVSRPAPNQLGQPVVSVSRLVPSRSTCGRRSAAPPGVGPAVTRLVLAAGTYDSRDRCGLTIDLFEDRDGAVSAVALTG